MKNYLSFIESVKGIAQNGLEYATNPYDIERYRQLLDLTKHSFIKYSGLDSKIVEEEYNQLKGISAPKVGVNMALIVSSKLFITKRSDDNCWELPGGWVELGESPREAIEREIMEETSIKIFPNSVIDVHSRKIGEFHFPFSSYHILIDCKLISSDFQISKEVLEYQWISFKDIESIHWHRDHRILANLAFEYHKKTD